MAPVRLPKASRRLGPPNLLKLSLSGSYVIVGQHFFKDRAPVASIGPQVRIHCGHSGIDIPIGIAIRSLVTATSGCHQEMRKA